MDSGPDVSKRGRRFSLQKSRLSRWFCLRHGVTWIADKFPNVFARATSMRVLPSLRTVGVLAALGALVLFLNSELMLVSNWLNDPPPHKRSWKELGAAQPYVYEYPTRRMGFPMLSLGARAAPACPGGLQSPPYVTVRADGRLGNLVMEYASAWALARAHGLPAFVPDRLLRRLQVVFEGLTLRGARETLAGDEGCRALAEAAAATAGATGAAQEPEDGDEDAEEGEAAWQAWAALTHVDLGRVPLAETVRMAREQRALIVLDYYSLLSEAVVPLAAELRNELRFRPLLRGAAQAVLHRLRTRHFPNLDGEVVFGAVHARRTDYPAQLKLLYNVTQPAGAAFFVAAAAWLRRSLPADQRLLLVVSSDDAPWAQEELVPVLAAAGAVDRPGGGWAAAWAGGGDTLRPDHDLALLSACNHTIFSYGTFGLSAALAAGGRAAVFQLARSPLHPLLLTPSEQFARHMPGWVALR